MNRRTLTYGSVLTGLLTLVTVPFIEDHPVVIAAAFPAGALTFLVVVLAAKKWGAA